MTTSATSKELQAQLSHSVVSKTMESFVYSQMWNIVKERIKKELFEAIKGSSATFALIKMVNDCLSTTDDNWQNNFVHVILLEYAKAFDHVNPNILMTRFEHLDIPVPLLHCIENFLIGRYQCVKIGQTYSD